MEVLLTAVALEDRPGAPRQARSKLLCCLASCSIVSSRQILCSRSYCRARCHFRLWLSANSRKSRQAWGKQETHRSGSLGDRPQSRANSTARSSSGSLSQEPREGAFHSGALCSSHISGSPSPGAALQPFPFRSSAPPALPSPCNRGWEQSWGTFRFAGSSKK